MNRSKDDIPQLPRIHSQTRVQPTIERKSSQKSLSNRPITNNRQTKRTISSANTCKAYKYETTGQMYAKKIQELERQNLLIDGQMKKVQAEIDEMRKNSMKQKREEEFVGNDKDSRVSGLSGTSRLSYRKNINVNDSKSLNNQIKISQNKIKLMRKRIDEHLERNQKLRREIDVSRKQISTLKGLNSSLSTALQATNEQFSSILQFSTTLDRDITDKNTLMHRTKIENTHKKAQIIKQYDNILKELDKQLESDRLMKNKDVPHSTESIESRVLYMTEHGDQKAVSLRGQIAQISPKKKRSSTSMNYNIKMLKERLQDYEDEFQSLKQHTGTKNADEITRKFLVEYEKNFQYYKFINQLHKNLEEVQSIQNQLLRKKDEILEQMSNKASVAKHEEIVEMETRLQFVKSEKIKQANSAQNYEKIYKELKEVVCEFYTKIRIVDRFDPEDVNQSNLSKYLDGMHTKMVDLSDAYSEDSDNHNAEDIRTNTLDLQQMLEGVKKQSSHHHTNSTISNAGQKLMSREQFIKSREMLMKKKASGNSSSRKNFHKK